jgi:hypothetical protein
MTESPFKDFEVGNMSAENYAKIDLNICRCHHFGFRKRKTNET